MMNKFIEWSKRKYTEKQKIAGFIVGGLVFLVIIPFVLLSIDTKLKVIPEPFNFAVALPLIVFGVLFMVWAGFVQFKIGKGTPLPAIPTQKLVTTGPYALCRNPMLLGCVSYYIGISLLVNSLSALVLTSLFLMFGVAYIKLIEEKELEIRFGEEYKEYKRSTPFLIPFRIRK